jgi:hypothetical protein
MVSAESQHYRPRYSPTSADGPAVIIQSSAPRAQVHGSIGLGWQPGSDVDFQNAPVTPAATECENIYKGAGLPTRDSHLMYVYVMGFCDAFRLVAAAATSSGGFDGPHLVSGVEAAGPSFRVASTFASAFGGGRAFEPGGARRLVWDDPCSCFRYPNADTVRLAP